MIAFAWFLLHVASEVAEYEELAEKLSMSRKVEVLDLGEKGSIYDELYHRGATPEEYAKYMESYGIKDVDGPMKYADISRSSYGEFRGSSGSRQYALKAWFKGNYFSLTPQKKEQPLRMPKPGGRK